MERKQARVAAAEVFTLGDLIGAYLASTPSATSGRAP